MDGPLQALANRCHKLALAIVAGLFAVMVLELWIWPADLSSKEAVLAMLGRRLPTFFYLAAIWLCGRSLGAIAQGVLFSEAMPVALHRIGWLVIGGAITSVMGLPLLFRLAGISDSIANFDVSAIAVGMLGLMLLVLARVFRHANAMRVELDEFF